MRKLRKLSLLTAAVVAAMAIVSSTAFAQTALEIVPESDPNTHCTAISFTGTDVNNGCLLHAKSEAKVVLKKHVFGIESTITSCDNEFHGRVDEDANGLFTEQVLSGAGCTRQPCSNGLAGEEKNPWSATGKEGNPTGQPAEAGKPGNTEYLSVNFCVESLDMTGDESCEIDVGFNETAVASHTYEFGHVGNAEISGHGISGFRCELEGHWNTEIGGMHDGVNEQEVIVRHTDLPS